VTESLWQDAHESVWRPLLNGEYPPPGKTKLGPPRKGLGGTMERPILVFARPSRCSYGGEGERCALVSDHEGPHQIEVRMER
jgi:hypothetical protein